MTQSNRSLARWLAVPLLLAAWLTACGADGRYIMVGTARAPSTSGVVEVDKLDDENAQVSIHLDYLHPPERIDQSLSRYVVWFLPKTGAGPVRGGELRFDPEQRTGDLTATSPFHRFGVKITAERQAQPAAPSDFVVATQDISLD